MRARRSEHRWPRSASWSASTAHASSLLLAVAFIGLTLAQQQQSLVKLPVWLFSSGPIGEAMVDQEGKTCVR